MCQRVLRRDTKRQEHAGHLVLGCGRKRRSQTGDVGLFIFGHFLVCSNALYCTRIVAIVSYLLKYTSIRRISSVNQSGRTLYPERFFETNHLTMRNYFWLIHNNFTALENSKWILHCYIWLPVLSFKFLCTLGSELLSLVSRYRAIPQWLRVRDNEGQG